MLDAKLVEAVDRLGIAMSTLALAGAPLPSNLP
jgi:hypothetical protein